MTMVQSIGIYRILCVPECRRYVGQSAVGIQDRVSGEFDALALGKHHNQELQSDYDKHGRNAFMDDVAEEVKDVAYLSAREQYWISQEVNPYNHPGDAGKSQTGGGGWLVRGAGMSAPANIAREGRPKGDLYITPRIAVDHILHYEKFDGPVWEPACGTGAISIPMLEAGLSVVSSDLYDWGYGEVGVDFLTQTEARAPNIATNPPFNLALKFTLKALELTTGKVAIFARHTFAEGAKRYKELFGPNPPTRTYVYARRVLCTSPDHPKEFWRNPGTQYGGGAFYTWFVWDKAKTGAVTEMRWIPIDLFYDRYK